MNARELKKELKSRSVLRRRQRARTKKVFLNGRQSIIASGHKGDIPKGTVQAIRKRLGI